MTVETRRPKVASTDPAFVRWVDGRAFDVVLAVALTVFGLAVLGVGVDVEGSVPWHAYLLAAAAGMALAVRRELAVPVLVVVATVRVYVAWETGDDIALLPAAAVALYTVARHGSRLPRVAIATSVGLLVACGTATVADEAFVVELVGEAAQVLLPVAVADTVRTRSDRVQDMIESEAEARVQAERLRIARDLHDVVAHGLSTIAIQSGVAARLIDRDPDQARDALDAINATGKSSLEELRGLLGVLRSTDGAELRPTPSEPDDLGDLLDGARSTGVDITHEVQGAFPADVSDAAVVAVHRIVQEALANVSRHAGPVPAMVRLDHRERWVDLEVTNDAPTATRAPVPSTGVGIVGMRERAESLGGTLDAAPEPGGGYRVAARVPYGVHL